MRATVPSVADMVDKRGRRLLQVRLTPEARAGIDALCAKHRLSLTVLFEAIGTEAAAGREPVSVEVIARAEELDRERFNR